MYSAACWEARNGFPEPIHGGTNHAIGNEIRPIANIASIAGLR